MKKNFLRHLIPLIVLFILNAIYFYPAYTGKGIEQDDVMHGLALSQESRDFREETGEEALWNNSVFSGMPTVQQGLRYSANIFTKLEPFTKLFQPEQIGLFLTLMFGFYALLASFNINPWISAIGALAFAFSTFFIIAFGAGHNAKLRAIGYMAPILMGVLLVYRDRRWLGLALTSLFLGLGISANHPQIMFYTAIIIGIITITEMVAAVRQSQLKSFFIKSGTLIIAVLFAVGPNLSKLWSTYEYSKESTRGGANLVQEGATNKRADSDGLDIDYAMGWSYGKLETLNLFIPNIVGGGMEQDYEGTELHDQLFPNIKRNLQSEGYAPKQAENVANRQIASLFYWGDQSFVNGAYYVGATIFALFVLGLFIIRDRRRVWIIASVILAVLMAWGSNLMWFNSILFEYLPLYNKFRVPHMTLTILFLLIPFTGMLALDHIVKNRETQKDLLIKNVKHAFYWVGGILLFIALFGPSLFSFEGSNDKQLAQNPQLLDMLIEGRKSLMRNSAFTSLFYISAVFGAILLFLTKKIKQSYLLIIIGLLVTIDIWSYDKQQLGEEDFVKPSNIEQSFTASNADQSILKDKALSYRVFNLNNPFNDAFTSYHHKSIGGYHAAKIQRYQELYENQLFKDQQMIVRALQGGGLGQMDSVLKYTHILNMLNGKYIIYNPQAPAIRNNYTLGNAWFVQSLDFVSNYNEEMERLSSINPAKAAIANESFKENVEKTSFSGEGSIQLTHWSPDTLIYTTQTSGTQFAVFSEIYYNTGSDHWQAYIDGEPADHIRVNYVLRGMSIPGGEHKITFIFEPKSYLAGEKISLGASIALLLMIALAIYMDIRKKNKIKTESNEAK